jgi:hypothetical protein
MHERTNATNAPSLSTSIDIDDYSLLGDGACDQPNFTLSAPAETVGLGGESGFDVVESRVWVEDPVGRRLDTCAVRTTHLLHNLFSR